MTGYADLAHVGFTLGSSLLLLLFFICCDTRMRVHVCNLCRKVYVRNIRVRVLSPMLYNAGSPCHLCLKCGRTRTCVQG